MGKSNDRLELLIIAAIYLLVNAVTFLQQDRITVYGGKGFDGTAYYRIAANFSRAQPIVTGAPFVYRIGTPFLASLVPTADLLDGFLIVNLIANTFTVYFLWLFFRHYLSSWIIRPLLLTLFILQWHAPVRFSYFYPAYIDPVFFTFLVGGLLLITKIKLHPSAITIAVFSAIMFLGAFFRETILLLAISTPFIQNPIDVTLVQWRQLKQTLANIKMWLLLPTLAAIVGIAITHMLVTPVETYSFLKTAYSWIYKKAFSGYILAWFISFGPVLAILFYDIRRCGHFLMQHQHLLVLLLGCMALAWIGGSDTERFCYWAMPVVYLLIGKAMENHRAILRSLPLLLVLAILQLISQRVLWSTPDYPNEFAHSFPFLTPIGEKQPYLDLWSYHGDARVHFRSLAQYIVCTLGILFWLHYRSSKLIPGQKLPMA